MGKQGTKRGPGRPPLSGKAAGEVVKLRITAEDRHRWEQQADRAGISLSEWIRQRCAP